MGRLRAIVLTVLVATTLVQPAPRAAVSQDAAGPSPRNANYTIAATLDPATHTISGSGQLRWRNATSRPATELQFHLYWNAWRDANSSWMREQALGRNRIARTAAGRGLRRHRRADDRRGGHEPRQPRHASSRLMTTTRTIGPCCACRSISPWRPARALDIELAWTSKVPRTFARTGRLGEYYFIAQWFPKIGVLEESGWNCHQFHASTEFFADFGVYDVTLTVPSGWVVGATGALQGQPVADGQRTSHRFVAGRRA